MSWIDDAANLLINQLGLDFIIPAIITLITAFVATKGKSWVPIILAVLVGAACVIILPAVGLNLNNLIKGG